ncbi:N-carbamoylsarcosine amidohydrolase [Parasphingorhabdus litoris]|uniref:N-carbamoylsarcosine amidohydrolase n=1 Tax=Parasphingorhabdus litoris TaxID=394733 RepID=A0ABN1AXD3_9SPHN|nr:isochorismatase family protein [Parasphingorhabdus litoris]
MAGGAADNYGGVFDGSMGFGAKPALILIDFVEAYFDPSCALYAGVEEALKNALKLRDAAREAGLLIVYTNVSYTQSMIDGGRFAQKVPPLENFVAGHPMGAWPKGLEPADDELVITKHYPSAFFGTSLASTLTANGNDSLIITGLSTSGCVRASCVDCCSHGFIPIIAEDAVGDRHEAPHKANLFDMQAKYADVLPSAKIMEYLSELKL